MALLTTGKGFIRDLEKSGALGIFTPLEGGSEGRYQRRLRLNGYESFSFTAKGLGDIEAYLTKVHGVSTPHLGKKNIGQQAAVGPICFVPPIATYRLDNLPSECKGLILWIVEGHVFSRDELEYLINLPHQEPRIKIVVELGGERYFRWESLEKIVQTA
ncbi:NAD(P)H-quinone oxidoreductase subunit N [Candidatus Atelocyanobacterium thalassae]|uniref:NAD(P)H-quinone oxidoreductase subunit N n=1 Tax=cyanobacterium endosymbiont of Braarudosphaera bigelowii TaxID=1285375 RepID=A0ABM7U4X7_9CHRO|nr:NAD(P)H-quinone oxidoreductase subunit N [Candidatus Atelocyanobacterium thalassa]BDA39781.1 NAD(P)H-quinone oxidoreductase subunit N [cyanobacterium endosymbiont of Braarudosphaera bigelowii]